MPLQRILGAQNKLCFWPGMSGLLNRALCLAVLYLEGSRKSLAAYHTPAAACKHLPVWRGSHAREGHTDRLMLG